MWSRESASGSPSARKSRADTLPCWFRWRGGGFWVKSFTSRDQRTRHREMAGFGGWRVFLALPAQRRDKLLGGEQAERLLLRVAVSFHEPVPDALPRPALALLHLGEVLELDEVAEPAPHGGVRLPERLADLPPRHRPLAGAGEGLDARKGVAQRAPHVSERLGQDLAGEGVGDRIVRHRGHDGALLAPSLVLVQKGGDLDEVQETGVVAPRAHPAIREADVVRERDHHRERLEQPLRVPVPAADGLSFLAQREPGSGLGQPLPLVDAAGLLP